MFLFPLPPPPPPSLLLAVIHCAAINCADLVAMPLVIKTAVVTARGPSLAQLQSRKDRRLHSQCSLQSLGKL